MTMGNLFDLTGKTVVAIGGNSVLGSSMVKGLADQGARVAVVGRNLETAEQVVQDIKRLRPTTATRSEEHTSELQSRGHLVCRLLLEKKKQKNKQEHMSEQR